MAGRMRGAKKGGKKGGKKGKRTAYRHRARRGNVPERALCSITQTFALGATNQVYNNYNLQLSGAPRAITIAEGYQLYRIKKVTYKFSPLADTFQGGSGVTVPYLYFQIDRTRNLQAVTSAQQLRQLGCVPKRLDDKIVSWSFRPSVLNSSYDSQPPIGQTTTQFNQYKISPWLNCRDAESLAVWNPDSTDHLGCVWVVENSGGALINYKMERIVEYEFMKPSYQVTASPTDPPPIEIEESLVVV